MTHERNLHLWLNQVSAYLWSEVLMRYVSGHKRQLRSQFHNGSHQQSLLQSKRLYTSVHTYQLSGEVVHMGQKRGIRHDSLQI